MPLVVEANQMSEELKKVTFHPPVMAERQAPKGPRLGKDEAFPMMALRARDRVKLTLRPSQPAEPLALASQTSTYWP